MIFNSSKSGHDISTYQDDPAITGSVNFDKMVANGASFVIMRSTVGNLLDVDFQTFKQNSRGKLPRAVYHYYWNTVSPITQAQLCLSAIGSEKFEGRVWLDLETTTAGAYVGWRNWKIFIETIQAAGLRVGIYTGYYWWKTNAVDAGADLNYFAQFPLWEGWYTSNAIDVLVARGWSSMMIWQHSSTGGGIAAGVESANIDQNKWNDSYNFDVEWGTLPMPYGYTKTRRYNSDVHIVKLSEFARAQVTKNSVLTTVSSAAKSKLAQYAINGDGWVNTQSLSLAASDGNLYNPIQFDGRPFVNVTSTGTIKASTVNDTTCYNLVSGTRWSVKAGVNVFANATDPEHVTELHPRSAIGYTASNKIILCVVDGRSGTNRGVTLKELSAIMLEAGAWYAVEMDGGGSSALFVQDRIVNVPSDGAERAVINHLLLFEGANMTLGTAREALGNIASVRNAPDVSGGKIGTIPGGATVSFMELVPGSVVATDKWLKLSDGTSYVNQFVGGRTYFTILTMPTTPLVSDSVTIDIVLHDVKVAGDAYTASGVIANKTA